MAHLWDVFYHSPMFDSWLGIVLNTTVQGSVIIGAAIIVTVFWRNASASVRHCIAAFALVSLLIVPVTSVLMPSWGISLFTISYSVPAVPHVYIGQPSAYTGETQAVIISNEVSDIEIPVSSAPLYRATILSDILTTAKHIHWSVFLFLVWLSGVIYLLIRLLRSLLKIRFLTADARMLSGEQLTDCKRRIVLDKNIELAENASAVIPMTVGWRKPIILVPVGFTEWNAKQRESIFLHELAHIKRNDCLTTALAVGAYIINWFNPLVWWTLHQFYLEREKACDDIVVSSGTKPAEYAGHLLELIRTTAGAKLSPAIMAFVAYNSFIPKRFSALFNTKVRRNTMNKKGIAGLCITTVCIISLFAGFKPFTNDAENNNDKAQKTVKQDSIPDVSTQQTVQKQAEITVPKVKFDYVPAYPDSIIKAGITGVVTVNILINKEGIPIDFKVVNPNERLKVLEKSVIEAVKKSRYKPAMQSGKPIDYWMERTYTFFKKDVHEISDVYVMSPAVISPIIVQEKIPQTSLIQQKTVKDTVPASLPKENQPRIGGFVDSLMKLIVWPESALKAGIKGNFVVGILLDKEGKPVEFKVLPSLGEREWDEAVIEAIKNMKIAPIKTQNLGQGIHRIKISITLDLTKIKDTNISAEIPVVSPIEKLTSLPTESSLPQQKKAVVDTIPAFLPEENWPKFDINELLKNINYPEMARLAGIQGEVIIDVLINKDGIPTEFKVLKSLGKSGCDESTIVGIKRTKFTPAIQNGKPVHFWIKIKVAFSLAKKGNITVGLLPLPQQKTVKDTIPAFLPEENWPKFDRNELLKNIKYPESARRAGVQGQVILDVLIDKEGKPVEFTVLKSLGESEWDKAVFEGIKKTKFTPAQQNGKPIPFRIKIKVDFSLGKIGDIKAVQPVESLPLLPVTEQKTVKDTIPSVLPEEDMPKIVGGNEAFLKLIIYPASALKAGIEGTVKVDVKINKDGRPSEIRILEPLEKNTELEIAVLQAIMKVRFIPAKYKGNPIDFWLPITVTFEAGKIKGEKTTQETSQVKAILPITEIIPPFLGEENWPKFSRDSLLKNIVYPESARKAGITGKIVIDTKIDRNGDPVEFKVINPQKKTEILANAMIEGIKKVKFRPATSNNRPVAFWIKIAVTFELDVRGVIK